MWAIILAALVLTLSACSSAPRTGPEAALELVEESAASIGGWEAMDAITGQEIITGGGDWEPLQAVTPDGEAPRINSFGQTILADFANDRMRLTFDAVRSFPAPAPIKFTEVIDGETAMLETTGADGTVAAERLHPSRYATRLRDLNRLPLRVLYVAKNAPDLTRVEDLTIDTNTYHVLKYTDGGLPVELYIDSFNKLPTRVVYTEDDPIYGDTLNEIAYSDWRAFGDVRLPQTHETFLNGNKIREERVRTLINNPRYEDDSFTIPDTIRSQPEDGQRIVSQWTLRRAVMGVGYQDFGREQRVELVEVAPGVQHVTGSTHHSMAVEMNDHIVVVEAPLYEERSAAVIRALEERFPGKPVRYVVITHFHIDHAGGLRAYAAKGATLLAQESIVPFINSVLERPKTIRPDAFAQASSAEPVVEGIQDMRTLTDGQRTVELRQVANPHAQAMLLAYLPNEKLVFVSDLYSPGTPIAADNPNVYAFYMGLRGMNMEVDRIIGAHGGVAPFRDLARAMETAIPGG